MTEGASIVVEQDRWAVEEQQKMCFPDEGYRAVHIQTDERWWVPR